MMKFLVSAAALAVPLWLLRHGGDAGIAPVLFLFGGYLFAERPLVTGGALDQPSLQKYLFLLLLSVAATCPVVAFVRWLNRRSHPVVRRVFVALSLVLLVHPLSILAIFTYDVGRYALHMGVTPLRLAGLVLGISGLAALALFAKWVGGQSALTANNVCTERTPKPTGFRAGDGTA